MIQTSASSSYREDLLSFLQELDDDLAEKREKFTAFLQTGEAELQQNPEFVRFLVITTDELIEKVARLNSLAKAMARTSLREGS